MAKHEWVVGEKRRYVLDPDDVAELERESGVHEFVNRHPKDKAEDLAYEDYKKKHHTMAAAHHLTRMKAAQATGNYSDAKRHKLLYDMHLKEMGLDNSDGKVPNEIAQHLQNPDAPKPFKFKSHKADAFFLEKNERGEYAALAKKEDKPQMPAMKLKDVLKEPASEKHLEMYRGHSKKYLQHVADRMETWLKQPGHTAAIHDHLRAIHHLLGTKKNEVGAAGGGTVPSNMQGDFGMSEKTLGDFAMMELAKSLSKKTVGEEADEESASRSRTVRDREEKELANIPFTGKGPSQQSGKVPNVGEVKKGDIKPEAIEEGSKDEEEEHHLGPAVSAKIAGDHLNKDPNYYDKSKMKKAVFIPGRTARKDPNDRGNPKERAEDEAEDARLRAEQRKRDNEMYGSDEPTYHPAPTKKAVIDPNKLKVRDPGIKASKLPPGAPGADKHGVGVQVDKKREANKRAARGKVRDDE